MGDTNTGDPIEEKNTAEGGGVSVRNRYGFRPPSETVNDGEEMCVTMRWRERAKWRMVGRMW